MKVNKVIRRRIRERLSGVDIAGDLNAVISANVNETGSSSARSTSKQTIVQRGGETEVAASTTDPPEEAA